MKLYTRQHVNDVLRLGRRQSYRIIGPTNGDRISSVSLLDMLNISRVGDAIDDIPDDLMTPEEIAISVDGIDAHEIKLWCGRTRNPLPHYKLNSHTLRVSKAEFDGWAGRRR